MIEKNYQVTGMTCASCSAAVQRVLNKTEGVSSAEVNLTTETLRVQYDETKLDFERLQSIVEGAGYGFREKPVDPPGFRERQRKQRAAKAKAEEAVGT